jgi:hypothetical protein
MAHGDRRMATFQKTWAMIIGKVVRRCTNGIQKADHKNYRFLGIGLQNQNSYFEFSTIDEYAGQSLARRGTGAFVAISIAQLPGLKIQFRKFEG